MLSNKAMMGAPAAVPQYIEDVFSTWLYTGNGSTQTITNGIDLAGEGGLVWLKERSAADIHNLYDTNRGVFNLLQTQTSGAQLAVGTSLTAFNANGFSLGDYVRANESSQTYASWTFRKAPKFFDVVTYTGNGVAGRTVAHNLGSVPGMIIVKRTDVAADWQVYHRSLANTEYMVLNTTAAKATGATRWNSTTPTASVFSLGTDATVNASGGTYVAYLFAHDAGGFGEAGDQNVVSCGSFVGNDVAGIKATLGWEPQWLLVKDATQATGDGWMIVDNMRGFTVSGNDGQLRANSNIAELTSVPLYAPNATGFSTKGGSGNNFNDTYIYLAIRRGPMKTPTVGTEVFSPVIKSVDNTFTSTGHVVDLLIESKRTSPNTTYQYLTMDRLRGINALTTFSTAAEYVGVVGNWFSSNTGFNATMFYAPTAGDYLFWAFRRAPGFFDVVCYTGTSVARTVNHNLGVAPELMIVKRRSASENWPVYSKNNATEVGYLDLTNAFFEFPIWNNTAPTSSVFSVGTPSAVNASGSTYVAYLFATVPNVSKVGSYTGTGGTQTINAGLPTGARFVLIKRTNSTGNWWVWDTARGMVSGTDPRLALNTTAAELNNNWVYTIANGFQIVTTDATINASGGSYIYLAIA